MKPVRFHTAAAAGFEEAAEFYEACRVGLGLAFISEVGRAVTRISEHPGIGAPYKDTEYRVWVLPRFPYLLFYLDLPEKPLDRCRRAREAPPGLLDAAQPGRSRKRRSVVSP